MGSKKDNNYKILLMITEHETEKVVSLTLKKHGYSVFVAGDKHVGAEIGENENPGLGIYEASDEQTCFIDTAIELYKIHDIPFIVISKTENEIKLNKAIQSGALSYLLQPFHAGQLLPVVKSAMQRAEDIRRLQTSEENLTTAIDTSRIISAAIGIMMERFRLTNKAAFELLRSEARSNQKKIIDLANEILMAAETVNHLNLSNSKGKE